MERKKRVVPREVCVRRSEKGNRYRKVALNTQKSAEVIVAEKRRTESIGVLSTTWKGGMSKRVQKTRKKAAHREIARNVKGM